MGKYSERLFKILVEKIGSKSGVYSAIRRKENKFKAVRPEIPFYLVAVDYGIIISKYEKNEEILKKVDELSQRNGNKKEPKQKTKGLIKQKTDIGVSHSKFIDINVLGLNIGPKKIKRTREKIITKKGLFKDWIQNVGTLVVILGLFLASVKNIFKKFPYLQMSLDILFVIVIFIILIISIVYIQKYYQMIKNKKAMIDWRIIGFATLIIFILWLLCKLEIFCII